MHELPAVFAGAAKHRAFLYELALFTAWHVAAFTLQAKAGKLESWDRIREKLKGTPAQPVELDWRARKAQRQQQMDALKKHKAQRTRSLKKPHAHRRHV